MTDVSAAAPSARSEMGFAAAFVALVLGAMAMGVSPIFVRYSAADAVGPFASAFWRMAVALPALYIWMRLERRTAAASLRIASGGKATSLYYPFLAGLAFTGDLVFWHLAIFNTSVANATFFATLMPVFVIGITWLILKRTVQRSAFLGIFICLIGGAILVGKTMNVNPENLRGDIYGIVTALFFGLYFLAIGQARQNGGAAARITFVQTCVTATALLVVAVIHSLATGAGFFPRSWAGVASLIALALVSQVGGQGLLTLSLGRLPTVFSSLVIFIEAITAALFGWLLLAENLTKEQVLGGILILVGIWISRPKQDNKPPPLLENACR